MPIVRKTADSAAFRAQHPTGRTLNLGGSGMVDAVNFDLQWDADVKGDAHEVAQHFPPASFDVVICTAMLQYCARPQEVVHGIHEVLRPGGLVYVDVPWVQPSCKDGDCRDLWRFSEHGLRHLFRDFEILDIGTSIPAVSALAFYLASLEPTPSRYLNAALRYGMAFVMGPVALTKWGLSPATAGGLYMVARKH